MEVCSGTLSPPRVFNFSFSSPNFLINNSKNKRVMLREINHELINSSSDARSNAVIKRSAKRRSASSCPVTIAAPEEWSEDGKNKTNVDFPGDGGNRADEEELEMKSGANKPLHALAKRALKVVASLANGGRVLDGSNGEDDDEDNSLESTMRPSPLSWHANCKTTFGIAHNDRKGTKISVFDRSGKGSSSSSSIFEVLGEIGQPATTMASAGAVPSAPFSPSSKVSKKRGAAPASLISAPCSTPRVANETTVAMAFRPDHPNEIAMTTRESGGVRVFTKVSASNNNNKSSNSSSAGTTTWKMERLPNDETEALLDSAVSDVVGVRVLDKLAWSPDGSLLATSSSRGSTIRIWDVDSKKSTAMSSGNTSGLSSIVRSIKRRKTFHVPKSKIEIMKAFSSIGSFKETLVPIEINTKRNGIISLAFSRSGRHLAAISKDGALTIWTKKSGVWSENGFSSTGKVTAFAWGPSPKAAAIRGNKRVREYDENEIGLCCVETALGTGASKSTDKRHISCAALQVAPNGSTRAALPITFPKIPGEGESSEVAAITSCAWDDTASRLVFGHADGKVRVYATIVHPVLTVRAIGTFYREKEDDEDALADEEEKPIEVKDIAACLQFSSGDSAAMRRLNDRAIVDRILAVSWGDGATSFVPMTFSASSAV